MCFPCCLFVILTALITNIIYYLHIEIQTLYSILASITAKKYLWLNRFNHKAIIARGQCPYAHLHWWPPTDTKNRRICQNELFLSAPVSSGNKWL